MLNRKNIYQLFTFLILFFLYTGTAEAQNGNERILKFYADIRINKDGLVRISEHIRVNVTGEAIQHGLRRTIPLYREDKFGTHKKINFEIVQIYKNGQPEDYHTEDENEQRSIYIGNADTFIDPGVYDYEITYQSKGHIGFFKGYDELYWNVTGTAWSFPIDTVSARIYLPAGAHAGNTACYTGINGSKETQCGSEQNQDGSVTFYSRHHLLSHQGLTVALAFTPGIIIRPGFKEQLFQEYREIAITGILLLILSLYYIISWLRYGRDPESPTIIPDFNVPGNVSPAQLRYLYSKHTDQKSFTIAIVNMAVKKALKIFLDPDGKYTLTRQPDSLPLSREEQSAYDTLLRNRSHGLTITFSNGTVINNAKQSFNTTLVKQVKLKDYFIANVGLQVTSFFLTVLMMVAYCLFVTPDDILAVSIYTPVSFLGLLALYYGIVQFKGSSGSSAILAFFGLLMLIVPAYFLANEKTPPITWIFIYSIVLMLLIYIKLIPTMTIDGAKLKAKILGFKMYLETAEQHRLNLLNPPDLTPQLFEKFLPYAMALDVENAWGSKFEYILADATYEPDWYQGNAFSYSSMNSALSRPLASSISSSTPPTSNDSGSSSGSSGSSSWSSGSDGGGSSGGGGGGGGGGGW